MEQEEKKTHSFRKGEDSQKNHFRSNRFVASNGQYFFMTRQNTQEGPFENKHDAERELNLYIRNINDPLRNHS